MTTPAYLPKPGTMIAMMGRPDDPSIVTELDGPLMPCGDIGYPTSEQFTLTGALTAVYAAQAGMTSAPGHTPPDTFLGPYLSEPFNFSVELFADTEPTGEQGQAGAGWLRLTDPGGDLESWLDYGWDGRAIILLRGKRYTDPATWERIASLTAEEFQPDLSNKAFRLRDLQYRLYAMAFPAASYGGAGGADGDAGLAGRVKPATFGRNTDIEPLLINAGLLIYAVHFRAVEAITRARDGASLLTFDADYPTYEALAAATIAGGHYGTCLALGLLRLATIGGTPTFGLRVDVKGDKVGGVYVETRGSIARRLATTIGTLTLSDPGGLDVASFASVEIAQPAPCGFHISSDVTTVGATLDAWMSGCAGWWTVTIAGLMQIGVVEEPADTADVVLAKVPDLAGDPAIQSAPVPRRTTRVGYQHNWSPQDVSALGGNGEFGTITAEEQRRYSEEWRYAEASDPTIVARHPAARTVFVASNYALEADAITEAARQRALFGVPRKRWRVPVNIDPFAEILGKTVEITGVNRLGWGASKKFRCVGIEASASAERTYLHLLE